MKVCSGLWIIDGRTKAQGDKTCIGSLRRGIEVEIYNKKLIISLL